ncbi:DUF4388 domain-containing protein [Undibacterium baiyunense]|uniref:DUF4388 domain-containing protein n=1 Tax=Undibacterium baiyunense TaxID=2828731 RepID=A0A941DG97_9BURK|nr:DUF4388 domain-containing protein [Undibacterium baiyunense]MBR7747000.1 DUF4388 domain-containing protein [Undibacterium baiyunense]
MNQQSFSPFFEIIDDIKQLCEQGRTGTIFLVSDNNRMAQVFLENGNIASILCRGQRGQEALNSLSNMQSVRLRFDDTIKIAPNRDGLSNQTVFETLLKAAGKLSGISASVTAKMAAPAAPTTPSVASPASFSINADTKKLVQDTLTIYIGPFAEIVCQDHFDKAINLRGLIEQLAGEIPNETSANQFRSELLKKLKL